MQEINLKEKLSMDVLIIGGGGSGLLAAVRAKEAGAERVAVLEKNKIFGGCARMAMGFFGVDTPPQKRLGIHHTVDECYAEFMNWQNWECNARLVRNWMLQSQDTVRWLEEKGIYFDKVSSISHLMIEEKKLGIHSGMQTGNLIVKTLLKQCELLGINMIPQTRAYKLIQNDRGDIIGVLASQGEMNLEISAGSVIIASGSITGNEELRKRFYPGRNLINMKMMGDVPHATGDGFFMAEEVGAIPGIMGVLLIGPHNHPHNLRIGLVMRRPHLIWVNRNGERYHDESIFSTHDFIGTAGHALNIQPGQVCFPIMDEKIFQDMITKKECVSFIEESQGSVSTSDMMADFGKEDPLQIREGSPTDWLDQIKDDIKVEINEGRVIKTNSLEEIAAWIGADNPKTLIETIKRYNYFCETGYDADFLKRKDFLLRINTPPYYAFKGLQGVDTCVGGILINHRMEVINKDHRPIKGLYAAGVAVSGFLGRNYGYPGTCLSLSLYSGYAGGMNAAKYALSLN